MFTSRVVYFLALFLSMFAVYVAARPAANVVDALVDVDINLDDLVRRGATCNWAGEYTRRDTLDAIVALTRCFVCRL